MVNIIFYNIVTLQWYNRLYCSIFIFQVSRCTYGLNNVGSDDPEVEIIEKKIVEEKSSLAMRAYLQRATQYSKLPMLIKLLYESKNN